MSIELIVSVIEVALVTGSITAAAYEKHAYDKRTEKNRKNGS